MIYESAISKELINLDNVDKIRRSSNILSVVWKSARTGRESTENIFSAESDEAAVRERHRIIGLVADGIKVDPKLLERLDAEVDGYDVALAAEAAAVAVAEGGEVVEEEPEVELKKRLIVEARDASKTWAAISKEFEIPESTARHWDKEARAIIHPTE